MENNSNIYDELESVDREQSERKVRKEKIKKTMMVPMATVTPDDWDAKTRTTTTNPSLSLLTVSLCTQV